VMFLGLIQDVLTFLKSYAKNKADRELEDNLNLQYRDFSLRNLLVAFQGFN